MWKQNIIKYQKTDGESVAGGGKIKRDLHPVIETTTQNKLLQGAANKVFTDTGISLPGNMTVGIKGRTYNNGLVETKKPVKKSFNFGQLLSSDKAEKAYPTLGMAVDLGNQFIDRDLTKNPTGFDSQQQIGDMLIKSGNPYAAAAGLAYKALSGIAEATGGNTNTITKDQAANVGVNDWERIGNNVLGVIPGLGWIPGTGTSEGQKSHLVDEMSNAYADSVYDINQSQTLGGGKYLFGRDKIERSILESNHRNKQLSEINLTNTMRKKSDYAQDLAQQNLNRYMGTNYMDMRMGKKGMKFPELDDIREMLKNRVLPEETIQKFAEGGSILPVGQRHKTLHHMDELGEQFEDLTRKGIPVVTVDESGDMVQIAEIECSEACFSKEVTDQLESLWKDGSEEAMIAAGKLIANEILYNMKDENNVIWGSEEQQKNL